MQDPELCVLSRAIFEGENEYDNPWCYRWLIEYPDGTRSYFLAPERAQALIDREMLEVIDAEAMDQLRSELYSEDE